MSSTEVETAVEPKPKRTTKPIVARPDFVMVPSRIGRHRQTPERHAQREAAVKEKNLRHRAQEHSQQASEAISGWNKRFVVDKDELKADIERELANRDHFAKLHPNAKHPSRRKIIAWVEADHKLRADIKRTEQWRPAFVRGRNTIAASQRAAKAALEQPKETT